MKVVNQYKCEICGTVYTEKKKCEACEAGHKKPTKIKKCLFRPIGINATGFPEKLVVSTKDGEEAVYKFVGKRESE